MSKLLLTALVGTILVASQARANAQTADRVIWLISVTNLTEATLQLAIQWEDEQGNRWASKRRPILEPGDIFEIKSTFGVRLRAQHAAIQVIGSLPGAGLTPDHILRRWGDIDSRRYLKARVKRSDGLTRVDTWIKD